MADRPPSGPRTSGSKVRRSIPFKKGNSAIGLAEFLIAGVLEGFIEVSLSEAKGTETDFFAERKRKAKQVTRWRRESTNVKLLVFPHRGKVYQLERIIKPVLTNPIGNDCGFVGNNGIYTPI